MQQLIEKFMDQEGIHSFEGYRGIDRLGKICRAIGYTSNSSQGGTNDVLLFLEDNPGVFTAIIDWIGNQRSPEWKANLERLINLEDDNEEE